MKKQILLYVILLLLSIRASAQTNNSTSDILKQGVISNDRIELVLKKLPPTITLSFTFDDFRSYTINFAGGPDVHNYQTPEILYEKEGTQHVQLKDGDFDGSKLLLSFADGKLTSIGSRTLKTPVAVPVNEMGVAIFFTKL